MAERDNEKFAHLAAKPAQSRVEAELVEEDFQKQPADEAVDAGEHLDREALEGQNYPVQFQPSTVNNPRMSEEEQNMELTPQVVGPPAYGSPDPTTTAGKLVPIEDHPLTEEISEDYGADLEGATLAPGEGTHSGGPQRTDLEIDTAGEGDKAPQDYEEMTNTELTDLARRRGISGYSGKSKDDLIEMHEEYDEQQQSEDENA